jgi:hypothetical protein
MAIIYKKNLAVFEAAVSVDEAEDLLQWIQSHPKGKADFGGCTHLHAAELQVLMAARIPVVAWPRDDNLKTWLTAALGI